MKRIIAAVAFLFLGFCPPSAEAHDWYTKKVDPVHKKGCCGGSDCAVLPIDIPGVLTIEREGYRVRLTLEQAKLINPQRKELFDHLIPWDRVQPSEDLNYHICIMAKDYESYWRDPRDGTYCFFEPPGA